MTQPLPGSPRRHSLRGVVALFVLAVIAVSLRLPGLSAPPVDVHHVRQADTANIARNMLREGVDVLHPRIDWAGPEAGYVESELPLYAAAVALGWRALGQDYLDAYVGEHFWLPHMWPRLLSVICWLLGGLVLLKLVRRRLRGPPWVYLLLYAFSPLAIVFSRTIQPDALAVFLMLCAVERADSAADREGGTAWLAVLLSGLVAGIAIAAKGTMALLLPLLPALLLARRRPSGAVRAVLVLVPAVVLPALWYWHAHVTLGAEGASFGVWGDAAHKWGGPSLWFSQATWRAILGYVIAEALTPLGLLLVLRGVVVARGSAELRIYVVAMLLVALGSVVLAEGFRLHDYYLLPLLPFASVLLGAALVDGAKHLGRWGSLSPRMRAGVGLSVLLLATFSVQVGWGFVSRSFRPDRRVEVVSRGAAAVIPRLSSVVVADRHPQTIIYGVDRRGWHRTQLPPRELRKLQGLGADYLLITETVPEFRDPELHRFLRLGAIPKWSGSGWVIYELRPAPPLQPSGTAAPG